MTKDGYTVKYGERGVKVLISVPVRAEAVEDVAQAVNALNNFLCARGLWVEVLGEADSAQFVLLALNCRQQQDPPQR